MNFSALILLFCCLLNNTLSARDNPFENISQTPSPFSTIPLIAMDQKKVISNEKNNSKTITPTIKTTPATTQSITPPTPVSKPLPKISPQLEQKQMTISSTKTNTIQKAVPIDSIDPRYLIDCCYSKPKYQEKFRQTDRKRKRKRVINRTLFHNCFLTLKQKGDKILIFTNDPLQAKVYLNKQKAIVVDFSRQTQMATQTMHPHSSKFSKITLGSHRCFYRLTIRYRGAKPHFIRLSKGYLLE